ncbi:MAG: methyltransferase [Elusimicrobiota bacterium]|jgi:protein-S-isoprenylcysteine O-methyltransferase Ste14
MPLILRWLLAILILPFNVLVLVPGLLLFSPLSRHVGRGVGGEGLDGLATSFWSYSFARPGEPRFFLAALIALLGMALSAWTVGLFVKFGEGTAAPWDPPKKFVVRGPYRYVRNPMIISVFVVQLAEAIFAGSWVVGGWMVTFIVMNLFYIPLIEEKGLEARFGDDYRAFKGAVPRWIPKGGWS